MSSVSHLLVKHNQLIKYGIIGCLCASLDFLIYSLLTNLIDISYLFANVISIHCGIVMSFVLNRHFTFKVKNKAVVRFISFYTVGIIGLLISSGLLILFVAKVGLNASIAKGITIVVVALIQFTLNKYMSFKDEKK